MRKKNYEKDKMKEEKNRQNNQIIDSFLLIFSNDIR